MDTIFAQFLRKQMAHRNMTIRDFAKFIGVSSHSVVQRAIDEEKPSTPDTETLIKISKALGVDMNTLSQMLDPSIPNVDFEAVILAQQIQNLPEEDRRAIDALLMGLFAKTANHNK